jgi:DNA-binding response OmpR family regulator
MIHPWPGEVAVQATTRETTTTILVVDDEDTVREVVERYLARAGYQVRTAADGEVALRLAEMLTPDLIILDLMLPRLDGLEVCRRLRARGAVPIIMLTARGEESDTILGLGMGADDYLVKPFSPRELVARVQAVLRRVQRPAQATGGQAPLRLADLVIDPAARAVRVRGQAVELTPREFDLLLFLAGHPGHVFTRDQLLDRVWDFAFAGDASTVTVHVRRLREKIERDPMRPAHLKTVWGVGYRFEP